MIRWLGAMVALWAALVLPGEARAEQTAQWSPGLEIVFDAELPIAGIDADEVERTLRTRRRQLDAGTTVYLNGDSSISMCRRSDGAAVERSVYVFPSDADFNCPTLDDPAAEDFDRRIRSRAVYTRSEGGEALIYVEMSPDIRLAPALGGNALVSGSTLLDHLSRVAFEDDARDDPYDPILHELRRRSTFVQGWDGPIIRGLLRLTRSGMTRAARRRMKTSGWRRTPVAPFFQAFLNRMRMRPSSSMASRFRERAGRAA